jgi:hypothetical protein
MSWLFSRALVEEYLADTCLDGEPSAPSSGSHTPQAYLPPDRMTAFSRPSRFGMTFSHLTADRGEALLTSYLAAFRARTSASQAREPASTEPAAACGDTWRGSLARFDHDTSSWRTAQRSLLGDSDESSVTWPRSGMTAAGQCWELATLAPPTKETGSGLWVPTPIRNDAEKRGNFDPIRSWGLAGFAKLWPTPRCQMTRPVKVRESRGPGMNLEEAVALRMWPTPTVCGNYNRKGLSDKSGDGLATAVMKCATPTARDWRSGKASDATMERNSRPLSEQIGGSLNPTWVEWLMGWPLGWTDLKPLETDKSHCALQQRGNY